MVLYSDLLMPKAKVAFESDGVGEMPCSNIEVHGGTTDHIRPDCLSVSVGCASACEGDCTESCPSVIECEAVTTLSSVTYTNCGANEGPVFN